MSLSDAVLLSGTLQWQSMDTAPKDGTLVLLCDDQISEVVAGCFDHCIWHCVSQHQTDSGEFGLDGYVAVDFSHWMPFPAGPGAVERSPS